MRWVFFLTLFASVSYAKVYITITGAKVKKAKIAIGALHPLPNFKPKSTQIPRSVHREILSDLNFTNLFEFISRDRFRSFDQPQNLYQIKYDPFALVGATFALKLGYKITQGDLILEAMLYDIAGKEKVFSTRYRYEVSDFPRLVHTLTEDILKYLTGERGLYRSRIIMVCRSPRTKPGPTSKEIYISDPDGRNFTALTSDKTISVSPAWTPGGRRILYTQYLRRIRKKKVRTIPVLKIHDLITGKRKVLSDRDGLNSGATFSPAGDKIALTLSYTGRPEVYLIPADGQGRPTPLSRKMKLKSLTGVGFQPNYESLLFDVEPSWSPNGKRIVFSSARTGQPMLYVIDLASKIANQLTFAGTYNSSPDWSPKGDRIAFSAQRKATGNFDIYLIDPDGNNLARLTKGGRSGSRRIHNENPSWAPTGRHLAYASNAGGKYAIYVSTVDGKVKKQISPPNQECTMPAWGPFEG